MSKTPLTEKQEKVYRFLVEEMSSGFPPTVREICAATGIKSTSTVHAILNALEEEGYIVRDAKSSRAIRLDLEYDSAMVPVVGKITAGQPILAIEEIEDYIPYPSKDAEGLFALRVSGLSMRDAGILDGDIIIADKNASCRSGDIVIGMDGDEATVKTFYKENGHFLLQPENETMEPIIVNEVYILGRVVANLRYY